MYQAVTIRAVTIAIAAMTTQQVIGCEYTHIALLPSRQSDVFAHFDPPDRQSRQAATEYQSSLQAAIYGRWVQEDRGAYATNWVRDLMSTVAAHLHLTWKVSFGPPGSDTTT